MPHPRNRSPLWSLPVLLLLTACGGAEPECDTIETRQAVLQAVADDHNNPLVAFAERDSSMKAALKDSKPLYQLSQKIVTSEEGRQADPAMQRRDFGQCRRHQGDKGNRVFGAANLRR